MKKKYTKQYIQFNDLVFDHVDMLTPDDASVSFKRFETAYTFKHGDYAPHKSRSVIAESYSFSMTITLNMKHLLCEDRKYYKEFAVSELAKIGRLWAVQGDTLLWAWAELDKFSEQMDSKGNELTLDVDVYIPEGIWHKADLQKTFLVPWDVCDFMTCMDYQDLHPCVSSENGDCCNCSTETHDAGCDCCECLDREMALCYHTDELSKAYTCHGLGYRIVYDCAAANRFFNTLTHFMGQKLCTNCGIIAGRIYSNTELPSKSVKIRIHGNMKNPRIEINGNANVITGEYTDLTVYPDGTVVDGCCDTEMDVDAWVVPQGMRYGWEINPGYNRVVIDLNNCCGTTCAYFELDPITL